MMQQKNLSYFVLKQKKLVFKRKQDRVFTVTCANELTGKASSRRRLSYNDCIGAAHGLRTCANEFSVYLDLFVTRRPI